MGVFLRATKSVFLGVAAIIFLSACASHTFTDYRDWSVEPLPSEQELDELSITQYISPKGDIKPDFTGGVSGRLLVALDLVRQEIIENHFERCEEQPLPRHLFFYRETKDNFIIMTSPRLVPARWPPPPTDPEIFDERYVFGFIPNSEELDGCQIQFTIDKVSETIVNTSIFR